MIAKSMLMIIKDLDDYQVNVDNDQVYVGDNQVNVDDDEVNVDDDQVDLGDDQVADQGGGQRWVRCQGCEAGSSLR